MSTTEVLQSMREAVNNGTAKVLTIEIAKTLIGKKIRTIYFGYRGQDGVDEFVVSGIISELDYQRTQPIDDDMFANRAEYWESYMNSRQLDEKSTILKLMGINGYNPCIQAHCKYDNYFDEPTFTCSDADRQVFYVEVE